MYYTHFSYLCQGLAALLLVLLYFWRHRLRKLIVPALFLWEMQEIRPKAGRRWSIARLPLPFYLELCVILLLALAATGPFFLRQSDRPALCIILDDSFSMLARENGATVCEKQMPIIRKALAKHGEVRWVLAGTVPRLLTAEPANAIPLAQWRCQAPGADIQAALALARSFSDNQNILVVTDHRPDFELPVEVHWSAKGSPVDNAAIVNAHRSDTRVLLELFNGAARHARASILVNGKAAHSVELSPKSTAKLDIPAEKDTPMQITLEVEGDALELDNAVTLLPARRPPLSYRLQEGLPAAKATLLRNTLAYSEAYIGIGPRELIIGEDKLPKGACHRLKWHAIPGGQATATAHGITFLDRFEALTRGLSRNGLQWRYSKELVMPGEGVAYHGDTSLISIQKIGDYFDIHLNLQLEGSNLQSLPFWPALFWNISDFLRQQRPGPDRINLRIGEPFTIHIPNKATARLDDATLAPVNGSAICRLDAAGLHELALAGSTWQLAANPLALAESDLTHAENLEILPSQSAEKRLSTRRRNMAPLLLALALAILLVHWHTIRKQ